MRFDDVYESRKIICKCNKQKQNPENTLCSEDTIKLFRINVISQRAEAFGVGSVRF